MKAKEMHPEDVDVTVESIIFEVGKTTIKNWILEACKCGYWGQCDESQVAKKKRPAIVVEPKYPVWANEELQEKIQELYEWRRDIIKKPVVLESTAAKIVSDLNKLSGEDCDTAIAIIQQSLDNRWNGLFPLREQAEKKVNDYFGQI